MYFYVILSSYFIVLLKISHVFSIRKFFLKSNNVHKKCLKKYIKITSLKKP